MLISNDKFSLPQVFFFIGFRNMYIMIEEDEWDTVSESDTVVECKKPFDDTSIYFVEWDKNTLLKNMFSEDYLIVENHLFLLSVNNLLLDLKSLRGEKIE